MASDNSPDQGIKGFLRGLLSGKANPEAITTEPKPNLLGALAEHGRHLKSQAKEALAEYRRRIVEIRRKAPALRLKVHNSDNAAWLQQPEAAAKVNALLAAGFAPDALFEFPTIPNFVIASYIHPAKGMRAALGWTPKAILLELSTRYPDGTCFESCNQAAGPGTPRAPWHDRRAHPEMSPVELLAAHESMRPPGPTAPVKPDELPGLAQKEFARLQAWRAERGGWTTGEIKLLRGLGDDAEAVELLQILRHEEAERWLFNWLRLQKKLPFEVDDVLEPLVIVYDGMPPDLLANTWWSVTTDLEVRSDSFAEPNARAVFERLNREHGEPLKRVWQKESPPAADYYLSRNLSRRISVRSELGDALNSGLIRGDLRKALSAVAGEEFETAEDAQAICEALSQLNSTTPDLPRQIQAMARLLQQVFDRESEAFQQLQVEGTPHLLRLFEEIRASSADTAADPSLQLLNALAFYGSAEGADRVIEAARRPLKPESPAWLLILGSFKREHPHGRRVLAALSDPLPPGRIAVGLLDAVNALRQAGETLAHPFDSVAGRQRLRAWLEDADPDNFSLAHSALAALPFVNDRGLFAPALAHPDMDLRQEAASLLAKADDPEGFQLLIELCGHWSSARLARHHLTELGRADLIPAAAREPAFVALAEMSSWLAHPSELGRNPDELEVVDHRELLWPPTREPKPFWLIRYRVRATEEGEPDDVGCGLVGSVTFCLFSYGLHLRSVADAYAVHCYWEMQNEGLIEEPYVDEDSDSDEHQDLLQQWTGEKLTKARVMAIAQLDPKLNPAQETIGVAQAKRGKEAGFVVLDGPRSSWFPTQDEDDDGLVGFKAHIGRQLLGI